MTLTKIKFKKFSEKYKTKNIILSIVQIFSRKQKQEISGKH